VVLTSWDRTYRNVWANCISYGNYCSEFTI
jgi:hypothetical protein